mmetsp:Transcript_21756/g.67038  ORF Transcript_21756/g.67038 Transcript_21756/m.67038 type:complete len:238 (+) Transcript_21756:108-821(+)
MSLLQNTLWKTRNATLPVVLRGYDAVVANAVSPFLWRCPPSTHVSQYKRLVRGQHLEVGPGSAYYLIESGAARLARKLTLVDLAEEPLAYAKQRLRARGALDCETFACDVRKPLPFAPPDPFDSCAANHVLHCVPGPMAQKLDLALAQLTRVLADDAVFFGSTVLQETDEGHTAASRTFVRWLNDRGIFYNDRDCLGAIDSILKDHFRAVSVRRVGAEAVFEAHAPLRRASSSSSSR